ncbi:MAG: hypothetical protein J5482_02910 [Oscillospiraceae bacterium]|nr:hypothetical protein [Oscillospiraceae bacterium]
MFDKEAKNTWSLQLFAEEGAQGTAQTATETVGATAQETGSGSDVSAAAESGAGATDGASNTETTDISRKSFREILQDEEYRREFDESVSRAVKKRMRSQRKTLAPLLEGIGQQYGMDVSDLDNLDLKALVKAYAEDESRLETEAADAGYTVDDWKTVKEARRIVADRRSEEQEVESQRAWKQITEEGTGLKQIYPSFSLESEMQNQQFVRLLVSLQQNGFPSPLRTAYESVHREELMNGAVRAAVQQTKEQVANAISTGAMRPAENGASAASEAKIDPGKLTRQQIQEYAEMAKRGAKITFR